MNKLLANEISTSLCDGLPFSSFYESTTNKQNFAVHGTLPPALSTRYMIHCLLTEAVTAIRRNINLEVGEWSASLNSLIQIYDGQIRNISPLAVDDMSKYHTKLRRVQQLQ